MNGGAYCASKFGVIGFTQVTDAEGKPHGVKASVVCPGPTDTKMRRDNHPDDVVENLTRPEEIADAIRRVSLLSTERSKGIKLSIQKDRIALFSSNPELGEARDEVRMEYEGPEFDIGFNAQYLLDFLTTVKTEKIRVELKDENNAILMRTNEDDEIDYKYVLMPMKI